jgi:hypothetical protein
MEKEIPEMKFKRSSLVMATVLVGVSMIASEASAALTVTALGTASPVGHPATVGMTAFGLDPQPLLTNVTQVAAPTGGFVTFDNPISHRRVVPGGGWATWSHGYTGDVYFTTNPSVTLTLPAGTVGFYLYAEPNFNQTPTGITVTATNSIGDVESLTQTMSWNADARGWAFNSTAPITSITVTDLDPAATGGFAVGEFGIAVPAPGALALLCMAGVLGSRRRRM